MSNTLAQGFNATTIPSYYPSLKYFNNIGSLVNILVPTLMLVAAFGFLAMIFYAGFKLLSSAGDPEKITEARNIITYGVIGLLIMMVSFLVVKVVEYVLGIDLPL